jgi:hypothetical protein
VLAKNSENLTEGKMGWDPSKYKSVEEWANKRAIGIVAELKEKYPNYNFNKISAETKLLVDFSDKADVKIVGFEDAKHLGGKPEAISDLEKNIIKDAPIDKEAVFEKKAAVEINEIKPLNIESEVEKVRVEMNKANTLKEISVAHSLGFSPSDYAELNDISIKSLFELRDSGNIENPNVKLKNFFNFMIEKGQIEDMDKSISETVRGLSDQSLQNMTVGYKIVSPEEYNVYINGLMRGEFELGISERGARNVFVNLDKIKSDTIGNQTEDAIFKSFKGAVEKVGIKFSYNDGDSVKSYVMKAMIKAYESGAIGKLRGELVEIDSNIKK